MVKKNNVFLCVLSRSVGTGGGSIQLFNGSNISRRIEDMQQLYNGLFRRIVEDCHS